MKHLDDTPLSKREIKKAARLFMLSMAMQIDDTGSMTDDERAMVIEARESAKKAMGKEYPTVSHYLGSQGQCVAAIKGMRG